MDNSLFSKQGRFNDTHGTVINKSLGRLNMFVKVLAVLCPLVKDFMLLCVTLPQNENMSYNLNRETTGTWTVLSSQSKGVSMTHTALER